MNVWINIAEVHLQAAKSLLDQRHFRGSANRAYYAAYSALTYEFRDRRHEFAHDQNNPSHGQILTLTTFNLDTQRHPPVTRRRIKQALSMLQSSRIIADYLPGQMIDRSLAVQLVRQSAYVLQQCAGDRDAG
jgi:hypothetical protein